MTFTEIQSAVASYCNITSSATDSMTRIGKTINRHYRRITSTLGLEAARFVTRSASMTIGVGTVTFTSIEKIDRVRDVTDATALRLLPEVSMDVLRSMQPTAGQPTCWATENINADSVTILTDTVPQTAYSLQADGWSNVADLSGTDEPAFPESFHDILVWAVIAEEALKKEKEKLAATYATKADKLLADLKFHLADSPTRDTRQGNTSTLGLTGSSGGGGGNTGGSSYTQTGLLTFDRDPSAPFAVTDTSAYVPNLFTEGVGNVTTDRLIGRDTAGTGESEQLTVGGGIEFTGSGGIQTSALTGDVTKTAGGTATTIAADAVTYAKMQNVSAASRLLGRGSAAGSGDPEEITIGSGLSLSGTALSVSAAGSMTLLKAGSGTSTAAGATDVDTVAITGLTALDTLVAYVTVSAVTQQVANPLIRNATDTVNIAAAPTFAAGVSGQYTFMARQSQAGATSVLGSTVGSNTAPASTTEVTVRTFTTNWTGSWTLALAHSGVTAGGTFRYSWALYKIAGQ